MKTVGLFLLVMLAFGATLLFFQLFYYNIVLRIYYTGIRLASVFNKKAKAWADGKKDLFINLEKKFNYPSHKKVWIHCASLGEFEQGRPLIEQLRNDYPEIKILLTFYSPSGYSVRKDFAAADYVTYIPEDTAANAKRFLSIVQPDIAVFVKYEFWYHHIDALNKNSTPLFLISGIFRKKQLFFRWYGRIFRAILRKYTKIFVQNEESLTLLHKIGITRTEIAYDTRFDRVKAIADACVPPAFIEEFVEGYNVIVAGSTWPKDERMLAGAFYHSLVYLDFKIIVAPHNINERSLKKTGKIFQKYSIRYSALSSASPEEIKIKRVLIMDNIGMLASLYKFADICYVGGGFGKGVHNILEAAVYGKPVMFGPNYQKFNEAVELVKANAAFAITDRDEMLNRINLMNQFQFIFTGAGKDASAYVSTHLGGTNKIICELKPLLA